MIAIVDYGVGNLFSLISSFKYIGADVLVTSDPDEIKKCEKIILPGVGAFEDAIAKLRATGLDKLICEEVLRGKKILGICLGMQMLFERSYEYGTHEGLSLLKGEIVSMEGRIPDKLKIPHIGWNALHIKAEHPIFKYVNENDSVYFVHSYAAMDCEGYVTATTEYGATLTAAAQNGNVMGTQFHPEKSGNVGLNILKAFIEM